MRSYSPLILNSRLYADALPARLVKWIVERLLREDLYDRSGSRVCENACID
jgi:hypothetical protein